MFSHIPAGWKEIFRVLFLAISAFVLILTNETAAQPAGERQSTPPADNYIIIHAGTLLAIPGEAPVVQASIIVKNDRIERVEQGFLNENSIPRKQNDSVQIVDLSDRFVLPGLMDAHVHLRNQPSFRQRRGPGRAGGMPADFAFNAVLYAQRNLAAGFTTVRDLGSDDQSVFAVRDAINAGRMVGPRILAAGSNLSVTGGHGDPTTTADPTQRMRLGVCDGATQCRQAVRTQHKLGADVIKYMSTGGFSSQTGLAQQMFFEEMKAIVDASHQLGLKVTTHAYDPKAIKDALRAGVDSIEHGFLLDDEGIQMMKARGVWLVPTLSASMPPPIFGIKDAPSVALRNQYKAFERAYQAGVKIAFGTDAGTFTHGQNAKEFDLMIKFGMSPMDAITAATVSDAALFGLEDEIGSLTPGKLADIIAVRGNPLDDITALHTIDFVMKSGKVAKQNGVMVSPFAFPPFVGLAP